MKTKGRRMSVNVEKALTFGQPRKKNAPTYKDYISAKDPGKWMQKIEQAAAEELEKLGQSPRTKQQKENIVHNYLNIIHKAGRTPMPSPRGKAPPKPKSRRTIKPETQYPGTHTSNKTTKRMVAGLEKLGKDTQPMSFQARMGKKNEENVVGGKQGRLKRK